MRVWEDWWRASSRSSNPCRAEPISFRKALVPRRNKSTACACLVGAKINIKTAQTVQVLRKLLEPHMHIIRSFCRKLAKRQCGVLCCFRACLAWRWLEHQVRVSVPAAVHHAPTQVVSTAQPLNITAWAGQTVMMVAAHPDDIEATAGRPGLILYACAY